MPKKCVGVELIAIFNPGVSPSRLRRSSRAEVGALLWGVVANTAGLYGTLSHLDATQPLVRGESARALIVSTYSS